MRLIIDLPPREEQIAFNRQRWAEIIADESLARLPGKVESNAFGNILMMPPASGGHSHRQLKIQMELGRLLGGLALPECPVSTINGVRAADVGWYSDQRFAGVQGQIAFETAPEICVEVLSPSNTAAEMAEKKQLYFEAGADEVWLCAEDGTLTFFTRYQPVSAVARSPLCPAFPPRI